MPSKKIEPVTVEQRMDEYSQFINLHCDIKGNAKTMLLIDFRRQLIAHEEQVQQEVLNELSREIVHKIQMTNLETFKDGFEIRGAILELIKAKGGDDGER